MKKIKVGIIGCGTIGSALARFVTRELSHVAQLSYLSEHHPEKSQKLLKQVKKRASLVSVSELIKKSDLIIEAASTSVATELLEKVSDPKKQVLILSVGGLLKSPRLLKDRKTKFWIPSGAIAGVDALLGAMEAGVQSVRLKTRKPPRGLKGAPYFQEKGFPTVRGNKEYRVFNGSAKQATQAFPQNVNVAAILSLAGVGPRKTRVEVWTSNQYKKNTHEIEVVSKAGRLNVTLQNAPSRHNPKTSALAIHSAEATLRRIFSNIRIGT